MLSVEHSRAWRSSEESGISLIEVLVAMTIMVFLLVLAAPSFAGWIRDSRVRAAAESVRDGVRFARAEAVRRNASIRLQFTSSLDDTCDFSSSGPAWVVNQGAGVSPVGHCGRGLGVQSTPFLLRSGTSAAAGSAVGIAATRAVVGFDPLGRQTPTTNPITSVSQVVVAVTATGGACIADGGSARCLNVVISPAGDVRVCDPSQTSISEPMRC